MKPLAFWCILAAVLLVGLTAGAGGAAHSAVAALDTATVTGSATAATATTTGIAVSTVITATGTAGIGTATATLTDSPTAGPTDSPTVTNTPAPTTTRPSACGLPAWHDVAMPDGDTLNAVLAFAPDDVWAAGRNIYHWDGANWHLSLAYYSYSAGSFGYLVAGATNSIWALGGTYDVNEHWDGSQWHDLTWHPFSLAGQPSGSLHYYVGAAAVGPNDAYLAENAYTSLEGFFSLVVQCPADHSCDQNLRLTPRLEAVGGAEVGDLWVTFGAELSHIVAGTVTPVAAPNVGTLSDITAIARDNVWAIGSNGILHWDGVAWTQIPSPAGGDTIAGRVGNDIWAAGTVVQHWNGTAWQVVPGQHATHVYHVSGIGPADVWTLGDNASGTRVIEHYAAIPTFSDVPVGHVFAPAVEWLACRGILRGYTCGGAGELCDGYSRPYARAGSGISRGQLLKLVVGAAGWTDSDPTTVTFADVAPGSAFYTAIEAGVVHGLVGGYACGSGPSEPCDAARRPYFRPGNAMRRGQLAQVITGARGYPLPTPAAATFADVAATDVFYGPIEAVAAQGIVSGYACGSVPTEPCDASLRSYYRPAAGATRGQVSKVVSRSYGGP